MLELARRGFLCAGIMRVLISVGTAARSPLCATRLFITVLKRDRWSQLALPFQ